MADLPADHTPVHLSCLVSDHVTTLLHYHSIKVSYPKGGESMALTAESVKEVPKLVPTSGVAFIKHLQAEARQWEDEMTESDYQDPQIFKNFLDTVQPLTVLTYNTIGTQVEVTTAARFSAFKSQPITEGWVVGRSYMVRMPHTYVMDDAAACQVDVRARMEQTCLVWAQLTAVIVVLVPARIKTLAGQEPDKSVVFQRNVIFGRFFNMYTGSFCRVRVQPSHVLHATTPKICIAENFTCARTCVAAAV